MVVELFGRLWGRWIGLEGDEVCLWGKMDGWDGGAHASGCMYGSVDWEKWTMNFGLTMM
jgi:hypothetical protein